MFKVESGQLPLGTYWQLTETEITELNKQKAANVEIGAIFSLRAEELENMSLFILCEIQKVRTNLSLQFLEDQFLKPLTSEITKAFATAQNFYNHKGMDLKTLDYGLYSARLELDIKKSREDHALTFTLSQKEGEVALSNKTFTIKNCNDNRYA